MKYIKIFLSRGFLIGIVLSLQVLMVYYFGYYVGKNKFEFEIAFGVLALVLSFAVVSKEQNPEFKLPWIFFILIFPFAGFASYMLFGIVRTTKKSKMEQFKLYVESLEYTKHVYAIRSQLKNQDKLAFGQAEYLIKSTGLPLYKNQNCKFLPTGEAFWEKLKTELKTAKEYIFIEIFIIDEGIMLGEILEILKQKIYEGVKVYFIYDDFGSLFKVKSNYHKKLIKMGINCVKFNTFYPFITATHNNRDHRKIIVIDGKKAFTGGINLADEYINKITKYGHWKDNAIYFEGDAVDNFVLMFLQTYNQSSKQKLKYEQFFKTKFKSPLKLLELKDDSKIKTQLQQIEDYKNGLRDFHQKKLDENDKMQTQSDEIQADSDKIQAENSTVQADNTKDYNGYILPFGDGPEPFYSNYIGETAYLNIINQAKDYVYITSPYLIVSYNFLETLRNAAKRGIDVRIITPHIPDKKLVYIMTKNSYACLIEAGVKIYEYEPGFIHSKMLLSDDKTAIVGTINLDYRSLVHHYENAVWLYDTPISSQIKKDFINMFEKDTILITMKQAKLNFFQKILRDILMLFAPLM